MWMGEWKSSSVVEMILEKLPMFKEDEHHDPMLLLKKLCFIIKEQISCNIVVRDQCLHCERKVKNTIGICTLPLFKMNR